MLLSSKDLFHAVS
jgi:hypothetical protein